MTDPLAAEQEYATKRLDREGIPVVLTVHDGTRGPDQAEGAAWAAALERYRAVLRPDAADDDLMALYDVLAVVSWVHRPGAEPLPPAEPRPGPPGDATTFSGQLATLRAGRFRKAINYHDVPPGTGEQLEQELRSYRGYVPAFYDGYRNHVTVAAPVCDRLGLRAWFLPPTGFLAAAAEEQLDYTDRYDFWVPVSAPGERRLAMTWDDLAAVARRHTIVAHTATHATAERAAADPDGELVGPRTRIEQVTGRAPDTVVFRLGAPWTGDPQVPAAGYRWLVSNTAIQRLPSSR